MLNSKKILIISEAHLIKTFIQATVKKLKEETGAHFDCFIISTINEDVTQSLMGVFENVFVNKYPRGIIKRVPKLRFFSTVIGLRKLARKIPDYDIIHIHYHYYYAAFFTPIIRRKTKNFFLTFFGSDFNQVSNFKHKCNQKSVDLADGIFATNEVFLNRVLSKYKVSKSEKKTGILMPLMDNFESFEKFIINHDRFYCRQLLGVQKKLIVCGYSAAPIVRHEMIIDSLNKIESKLHDYQVIFPMTYGNRGAEMRATVKEKLKGSSLDTLVFENFLTIDKLQALRVAADIFIHIQERDQMAASMLEHLAAGSVVITGKWLPYEGLVEKGVYFISMKAPEELSQILTQVIDNLEYYKEKSKVNRKIILEMMSWDLIKRNWYKFYELEQKL